MPRLSCCLIAWNEATDLPRWLPSTARLDSELIVVDTGSTDRTPEITAEFGARVLNHVWRKDVSAARNVGLDAATDAWILSLDPDDELPPARSWHCQRCWPAPMVLRRSTASR